MKTFIFALCMFITFQVNSQSTSGAPNPPNHLCYNYDRAGNRIAQIPSWLTPDYAPEITCVNDDPDVMPARGFGKLYFYPPWGNELIVYLTNGDPNVISTWGWWIDGEVSRGGEDGVQHRSIRIPQSQIDKDLAYDVLELSTYPNPSDGKFTIHQKGFDAAKAYIVILDATGQIIFKREFVTGQVSIPNVSTGQYTLILSDGQFQKSTKFVIF